MSGFEGEQSGKWVSGRSDALYSYSVFGTRLSNG